MFAKLQKFVGDHSEISTCCGHAFFSFYNLLTLFGNRWESSNFGELRGQSKVTFEGIPNCLSTFILVDPGSIRESSGTVF